jgi:hypothetical protein
VNKAISVALIILISAIVLGFSPHEIRTRQMDSRAESIAKEIEKYLWLLDSGRRDGITSAKFVLQFTDYLNIKVEEGQFFVILRQGVLYGIGKGNIPSDIKLIAPSEARGRKIMIELSGDCIRFLVSG